MRGSREEMKKFQQTKEVLEYSSKYISGKVLDLGAGKGKYKLIIVPRASKYTALDIKPGKNIDVVGDATDLPFKEESFNTVICTQVLEHTERPWVVVREIKRILTKDGVCILTTPFLIPSHSDPNDYFRFTCQGLESLFKNEDFEIIESGHYCQLFSVASEWIRFLFFSPYKSHGQLAKRFIEYLQKISGFLDKFTKNKIIYGNVYIIARKK